MFDGYTLVCGVDAKHLKQLALTWPTWRRHKPSLLRQPMLVFFDHKQVKATEVFSAVDHPDLSVCPWPFQPTEYEHGVGKFNDGQRYRMLAGFVHVPATVVDTRYWLKLDCDVVATGHDDWIDPAWFADDPAIVAHRWTFTKPADQMLALDGWAEENRHGLPNLPVGSLDLAPKADADRLSHNRIISWCGFFETKFTRVCAEMAALTCGEGKLPVRSQDGFHWYCAQRLGRSVVRAQMKSRGFEHWATEANIRQAVERSLGYDTTLKDLGSARLG